MPSRQRRQRAAATSRRARWRCWRWLYWFGPSPYRTHPPRPAIRRPATSTTAPSAFTAPAGHGGCAGRPARRISPFLLSW